MLSIAWKTSATLPIPDWDEIAAPEGKTAAELHKLWNGIAHAWLAELSTSLGTEYKIAESPEFLLLGALTERQQRLVLDYAERTRKRVLNLLSDIARDEGYGRTVILAFDSADRYYEYVANYYPDTSEGEEFAFSSGMFIDSGYGHFVFVADDLTRVEPVIAHELTHALVRHLLLPLWINEGIAVRTERRLCPTVGGYFTVPELKSKYASFWNNETIQEFWSGKSWRRPDDGNALSYELATTFVGLAARDWPAFASFVCAADAPMQAMALRVSTLDIQLPILPKQCSAQENGLQFPPRGMRASSVIR